MASYPLKLLQMFLIVNCVIGVVLGETENFVASEEFPQETQHAVCKVFTKEIEATAKATITRQLKGVCSAKDLDVRFEQLQTTIFLELQDIKRALGIQTNINYKALHLASTSTSTSSPSTTTSTTEPPSYDDPESDYTELEDDITVKVINMKNLERSTSNERHHVPDDATANEEISMYNDTIVESSEGDLYFYYWKIVDIRKVLKKRDMYMSSPSFSVLGHTLYLQIYPNYMDDYVGILLKPDSNSFLKKHKIIFLGRTSTQNVISSKILYGIKNEDKIFKIEPQMLNRNFILDNTLLVKLKIYLSS